MLAGLANLHSSTATAPVTDPLRESDFFDCGRDQIRPSTMSLGNEGQKCVVRYTDVHEKEWVSGNCENEGGNSFLALVVVLVEAILL